MTEINGPLKRKAILACALFKSVNQCLPKKKQKYIFLEINIKYDLTENFISIVQVILGGKS